MSRRASTRLAVQRREPHTPAPEPMIPCPTPEPPREERYPLAKLDFLPKHLTALLFLSLLFSFALLAPCRAAKLAAPSHRNPGLSTAPNAVAARRSRFAFKTTHDTRAAKNGAIHSVSRALRKGGRLFARRVHSVLRLLRSRCGCSLLASAPRHRRETPRLRGTHQR